MAALCTAIATLAAAAPVDLSTFVRLRLTGLGRYQSAPALFLAENRGGGSGLVLPVPVPFDSEMAIEQALSPARPAILEVLLSAQAFSKRDDALFESAKRVASPLHWQHWTLGRDGGHLHPRGDSLVAIGALSKGRSSSGDICVDSISIGGKVHVSTEWLPLWVRVGQQQPKQTSPWLHSIPALETPR